MIKTTQTPNIQQAAALLAQGKLVAFPTETVYGLGADATNEEAVRRIFDVKERPYTSPLIVHLARHEQVLDWVVEMPPLAKKLAEAFWPGPLTLILRKASHVLKLVTGDQETVAIRIPAHPVAQQLLQAFGGGVVAPSANKFTHLSPTTSIAVAEELGGRIDYILEGGECEVGLESTIVDVSGDQPMILRPGMITPAQLEQVLLMSVPVSTHPQVIQVPGMHILHYAPRTHTQLITQNEFYIYVENLSATDFPIACLTHSGLASHRVHSVKISSNPQHYAHDLYRLLRELDHQAFKKILIEAVPSHSEWIAIQDRLQKATARG